MQLEPKVNQVLPLRRKLITMGAKVIYFVLILQPLGVKNKHIELEAVI